MYPSVTVAKATARGSPIKEFVHSEMIDRAMNVIMELRNKNRL